MITDDPETPRRMRTRAEMLAALIAAAAARAEGQDAWRRIHRVISGHADRDRVGASPAAATSIRDTASTCSQPQRQEEAAGRAQAGVPGRRAGRHPGHPAGAAEGLQQSKRRQPMSPPTRRRRSAGRKLRPSRPAKEKAEGAEGRSRRPERRSRASRSRTPTGPVAQSHRRRQPAAARRPPAARVGSRP